MDRDALRHVVGADRPVAEAVRQRRRLGLLGKVTHQVVQRAARLRESVSRERCAPLGVVLVRERGTRRRFGQDLVEQVQVLRMDVVLEPGAAILLQPRPGDDTTLLDPEADLPLVLAALVLAQSPRDVPDVPRRPVSEQAPLLECELLHPCDDLWRESHRGEPGRRHRVPELLRQTLPARATLGDGLESVALSTRRP